MVLTDTSVGTSEGTAQSADRRWLLHTTNVNEVVVIDLVRRRRIDGVINVSARSGFGWAAHPSLTRFVTGRPAGLARFDIRTP